MAYDEGLATRVRELLLDQPGLVEKQMFGGLAFLVHGNMACGVRADDLIVRVAADTADAALAEPGVRPFDLTGRPMKGWLLVGTDGHAEDEDLRRWVDDPGLAHASSLPAQVAPPETTALRGTRRSPTHRPADLQLRRQPVCARPGWGHAWGTTPSPPRPVRSCRRAVAQPVRRPAGNSLWGREKAP